MGKTSCPITLTIMDVYDNSDVVFELKKALCALGFELSRTDKYEILKWLSEQLNTITEEHYNYILNWNNASYRSICINLKNGIGANNNTIEVINLLRWGTSFIHKDVAVGRDILYEYYPLSLVVESPRNFSKNVIYAHVNILNHYWMTGRNDFECKYYAKVAMPLLECLASDSDWFKSRSNYYLSMVYNVFDKKVNAFNALIDAIVDKNTLPHHRKSVIEIIFNGVGLPEHISPKLICDDSILNPDFWNGISSEVCDKSIKDNISLYSRILSERNFRSYPMTSLSDDEVDELNAYLAISDPKELLVIENKISLVLKIANDEKRTVKIRSRAYEKLAYHNLFSHREVINTLYYFSMALYLSNNDEFKIHIQRLFINEDEGIVINALQYQYHCNYVQAAGLAKKACDEPIWVNGDPSSEIVFLEQVILKSECNSAINLLGKIRVSFLYIKGECTLNNGLRIQGFSKAEEYLSSIKLDGIDESVRGIRDYGFFRQQSKLINSSEYGDYIYLEEKGSDRLIIAFSCRYSYNVFPSVPSFVKSRKTNVLFINNPLCNWYSDEEENRVDELINLLAIGKFERDKILCYSASMGGYAALKFSRKHNLMCFSVNPQFNLNLWALARPADSDRIYSIKAMLNLDKIKHVPANIQRACVMIGRHPVDLLAFQAWFDNAIKADNFTFIIIKHDIPEHAGLIMRVYGERYMDVIHEKFEKLISICTDKQMLHKVTSSELKLIQSSIANEKDGEWGVVARNGEYFSF